MTMELASMRIVRKPWGKTDLRPWSELGHDGVAVGEIWFQRADKMAPEPALLLKLLFTDEALSIQVHPDDSFAQSIGLPHGKTEAWYVLSATADARVALGLKRTLTPPQLRAAIEDGSVAELVHWQSARADDAILVPAGTIHAIGAGLVIAEIQQRSDATFRLFDYGRRRELHLDGAVGSSTAGPATQQTAPLRLSDARSVLAQSPYFVLEQIDLEPNSHWEIDAKGEAWILLLEGDAKFDLMQVELGQAMFIDGQRAGIRAGDKGVKGLLAYVASAALPDLLHSRNGQSTRSSIDRVPEPRTGAQINRAEPAQPWETRS